MPAGDANAGRTSGAHDARLDRRSFLRGAGKGLSASAILSIPGVKAAAGTRRKLRPAYRLSSHGLRVCSACKSNNANRFYRTADDANKGRAHLGCNCRIVTQDLLAATWMCYFRGGRTGVYDLRWKTPKCPRP
jgi:hypothetical protein